MLNVTFLTVGKLKEAYFRDACAEYLKRLGAFCKPTIAEVDEYRLPQNPSPAEIEKCIAAEGEQLLAKLPARAHVVALCIEGDVYSSEVLARKLSQVAGETSQLAFVIGGSHGLSHAVKAAAKSRLSMSPMTFPHQLARVMLLEQVYRGFSIDSGGKYHK